MGTAPGPVNIGEAPVGALRPVEDVQVSWDVVLVGVASGLAVLPEEVIVLGISDDVGGQVPVHLEPLGTFPPLAESDVWEHVGAVAASAITGWVIVHVDEAMVGAGEVLVHCREVVHRDAAL